MKMRPIGSWVQGNQQFEYGKRKGGVKSPLRTHKKGSNLHYENTRRALLFKGESKV
jgi:hypothetical protein